MNDFTLVLVDTQGNYSTASARLVEKSYLSIGGIGAIEDSGSHKTYTIIKIS